MSNPEPQIQFARLTETANEAIARRDWATLRLNAQLMLNENPSSSTALSYMGVALVYQGLERRSEALIKRGMGHHMKAVDVGENDSIAWQNLALGLDITGEYERELEAMNRATELDPANPLLFRGKSHALMRLNRIDEAGEPMHRALGLLKSSEPLGFMIHSLYLDDEILPLKQAITLGVRREKIDDVDGVSCDENELNIYGYGLSFRDAIVEVCEDFYTLVEEYVDTTDPLDEGGHELAARLCEYIAPEARIGGTESAG
jgi:tetratricopeptide (TPR) repeat protein